MKWGAKELLGVSQPPNSIYVQICDTCAYESNHSPLAPISSLQSQASLELLWRAALPRLHAESRDVASCVMLLDALLRGAHEELLMTPELRSALDELLGGRFTGQKKMVVFVGESGK